MNSRCFCLFIASMIFATVCGAQTPCQTGKLSDMMGKQCMLGHIVFSPFFSPFADYPDEYKIYVFQPDAADPDNPGFTISRAPGLGLTAPLLLADSTYNPGLPFPNGGEVLFNYRADLPCSGPVCETLFAPVITAVTAEATDYSIDLSAFPTGFGSGLSAAVHGAFGFSTCDSVTFDSVTTTAGEQLDNESPAYDINWGFTNSAAFACGQRTIEGNVTAIVEVNQCASCDELSTVSLGSASFYFHTRTTQAFLNGDSGGGASQPLPRILAPFVAFSALSNKLETTSKGFQLTSTFTLGNASAEINPLADTIALQVGTYAVTLPPGSLHVTKKGYYVYQGTIDGESLQLQIVSTAAANYVLKAEVSGGAPFALQNPVLVALAIGNDFGAAYTVPND